MSFKKFLYKFWICILGIITAVLFVVIVGLLDEFILCAHASDIILTPSQTLAMYGSSIPVSYYNNSTGITYNLTANYHGLTSSYWMYNDRSVPPSDIPFLSVSYHQGAAANTFDQMNYTDALIYEVDFTGIDFVSSNSADHFNITVDLPFSFSGITGIRCPIFWSSVVPRDHSIYTRSSALLTTSIGDFSVTPPGFNQHATSGLFWFSNPEEVSQNENYLGYFPVLPAQHFTDGDSKFDLTRITYGFNRVRCILGDSLPAPDIPLKWYFFVECPLLSDWSPPETTLPPVTTLPTYTTRPHDYSHYATTPANTLDLSQIEENQRIQIEIENDNRNFNAGSYDGINIIIDQLNDIYSLMQARGEIAVDLLDAPHLPSDPSISRYVDDHLESFTTAQLPDETLTGGIGFIGKLVSWFTDSFGWLWVLAALNLSLAVLSFAIFRSKGG